MPLPGTIAITDFGWYSALAQRSSWEEVNFWTPSSYWSFRAPEFSPFLFKLKAPHNAISGFGYFARYSRLPDWLAWQCFGVANGCGTFDELRQRLEQIRQRFNYAGKPGMVEIGCIIVVNAVFFPKDQWIPQPRDWPVRTLRPTRYDLASGEGARVWNECLARVAARQNPATESESTAAVNDNDNDEASRYGASILIRPRLGQGAFRVAVTDAYSRACAVTGEHSLPALEAAHIRPFAKNGPHEVRNGLCLRADFHRLFEQGYLTITTDHRLEVSSRLKADFQNGRSYYPMHGSRIALPEGMDLQPDESIITWHNQNVFLG